MSVNIVKSSACHTQRFAREARTIEKDRSWRVMSAREKLVAWKSPLVPGKRGRHIVDKRPTRTKMSASDSQRSVRGRKKVHLPSREWSAREAKVTRKEQSTGARKWFVGEGKRSVYYGTKVPQKKKVRALRAGCPRIQSARKREKSASGVKVSSRSAHGQK